MSTPDKSPASRQRARMHGFTLVELMVTISIALFLMGGLVRIVQNVRLTYGNQQALAQLEDAQRFAMTVITDVVQSAGYFPTPVTETAAVALPVLAPFGTAGQALFGTHAAGVPDTLQVRYRTAVGDGVILCDGSANTASGPDKAFTNIFTVVPSAVAGTPGRLWCSVNNVGSVVPSVLVPGVALVEGVQNLAIYYGVKRNIPLSVDYNVDTYLTADQMTATDWMNVSSLKVRLTFTNPLFGQTTTQPATIDFERIIPVMGRAGIHT
jgi:type IV pilus assembly protein PilW